MKIHVLLSHITSYLLFLLSEQDQLLEILNLMMSYIFWDHYIYNMFIHIFRNAYLQEEDRIAKKHEE